MSGRWWTLHFARPTNLDADGRLWTFWRHSQGAGIETRAAHQISPEDFERSRSCIPTVATARNSKKSFCGSEEYMPAQRPARFTPPRQAPFPFFQRVPTRRLTFNQGPSVVIGITATPSGRT
jgi:hypothetical protein